MRTKKDLTFHTRGGLRFMVPAGSAVEYRESDDTYFVAPAALPENSFERHDATYYGLRVAPEEVDHES